MNKTILIPTDLTVESLNSVRVVLEENQYSQLQIILVCPVYMPDSLTEMLYYNPEKVLKSMVTTEFSDGLAILKNRFSKQLLDIKLELFHGINRSAFNNFVAANGIDEIVIPANYELKKLKNGFDILPYIRKSTNPVTTVEWSVSAGNTNSPLLRLFGV